MHHLLLLLVVLLATPTLSIIRFSNITADKGELSLAVWAGAKLYVASSDDITLLSNVKITNNGEIKTAWDLSQLGTNPDGSEIGWKANGTITISSTNVENDAMWMTGFLYFTTFTQAQDPNFHVYLVNRKISITSNSDDVTLVFLNLNLGLRNQTSPLYIPDKSSQVSSVSSLPTSSFAIFWNEPMETYKDPVADASRQQRIFSNPLRIDAVWYFANVEPFQVFNDVWYIRSNGFLKFDVQQGWDDPNGGTTSAVTTTGLLMSSYAPENVTIHMISNAENSAISGLSVIYNLLYSVSFQMSGLEETINTNNDFRNARKEVWVPKLSNYFSVQSN
ncbi:hypothetical protein GCK72_016342 [Caenorhabditis remanei]|uniref:Bulb-type lectin domain-containing protein n=1 Tax=Caenorhabditis remanei TaxID=31234 RepID=A0A6A5GZ63_CAERE|nr:hypothetical protein GCK72_016342 [Caenorhabditis remanei]KAF1759875.1 hypothetical protein GCK72_016342 [Caenorhabditis remanei]